MKRTALAIAIGAVCTSLSTGVLAQEENRNDTSNANQASQQQGSNGQTQPSNNNQTRDSETRDINVEQKPAEVKVEQDKPDITVEQSQPEVTIEQPEPNVTVEEAEPNVTVEQTGEPEVTVEQAEDAEVNVNQDEQERQQDNQQRDQASQNQTDQADQNNQTDRNDQSNPLMSQRASDLEGRSIANREGEEIGEVQHIAKHNDSGELFAIVSVGGFWGIGATDIALPLNDVHVEDDQLVVSTTYGSNEIEDSSNDYQEDEYSEVDSDMTLSEAKQQ
ncbi:PRC-barrel domain-containing protein [Vreelandella sp. V005]|uniref:PRC-barrel domain-containing protein n=1 Tax=Vreelandella sp. V005 TaxID=3459608 RepID=UPI0040450CB5